MRSASSSLAAAIILNERVIRHDVFIDFDNDGVDLEIDNMSHKMGHVSVTQSLESSLPTAVRTVPGAAVAQLNVDIERGNTFRYSVPVQYRTFMSASGTTQQITIQRPPDAVPGDVIIVSFAAVNTTNQYSILLNANASWATIGIRSDGSSSNLDRVESQTYTRRMTAADPPVYTFQQTVPAAWAAVCVAVGGANIIGILDTAQKGQDDNTTVYATVVNAPVYTTFTGCSIVSIFAANSPVSGSGQWTALDGDTKQVEVTSATQDASTMVVTTTTADIPPSRYQKRIQINSANVTAATAFSFVMAPKIAGDEQQHAAWTFSELNTASSYYGKLRIGRRTTWSVGLFTEAGLEQIQVFTGLSLTSGAAARSRSYEFSALDNREMMRKTPQFRRIWIAEWPIILELGDTKPAMPGLEVTYIVSFLFFYALWDPQPIVFSPETNGPRNGYGFFPSPVIRTSAMFWSPCHGSVFPYEGGIEWCYTQMQNFTQRRVRFVVGPWVAATEPAPVGGFIDCGFSNIDSYATFWNTSRQLQGRLELYAKLNQTNSQVFFGCVDSVYTITRRIRIVITASSVMTVNIIMDGGIVRNINGPTVPTDGAWHFYGAHVDSVGGQVVFRIDGTSTIVPMTVWTDSAIVDNGSNTELTLNNGAQVAELMIHGGYAGSRNSLNLVTPTTPWIYENFIPTAFIDKSETYLDTLPFIDLNGTDIWDVLTACAETEFAAVYFDGTGRPHYRNGRSNVTPAGQVQQRILTARSDIKDLQYESATSQVANVISVGYTPHIAFVDQQAWSAQGAIYVPPLGSIRIDIQMPGVIIGVNNPDITEGNTSSDGTGAVIPSALLPAGAITLGIYSIRITIFNITNQGAWLVNASGQASASLIASWMGPASATSSPPTRYNSDSVRAFMQQPLPIAATVWRQTYDVADSIALGLISDLGFPNPVIKNVPIVGDPRLELGDMVGLVDQWGIGVNGKYRLTAIKHDGSPQSGYAQDLTVRQAAIDAYWNANFWNNGTVWGLSS